MRKSRIKLNVEPSALVATVMQLIIQANSLELSGLEKRKWVAKRVADYLDDAIKLPFFLELFDGPVFLLLATLVQVIFDATQKPKTKAE